MNNKKAPALFMSRDLGQRLLTRRSFATPQEIQAILELPEEERARRALTRTIQDCGLRSGKTWIKIVGRRDPVSVLVNPADSPLYEALEPARNFFWYREHSSEVLEGARRAQARLDQATDLEAHKDPAWRSAHARLNRLLQSKRSRRKSCPSCQSALRELEKLSEDRWEEPSPAVLADDERAIYYRACRALNACPSCSEYLDPSWEELESAERSIWYACAQRLAPAMRDGLGFWTAAAMAPEEEPDFGLI